MSVSAKPFILTDPHQLENFDTLIDVRSPLEYAEDHLPTAINCPALNNIQRAEVGTLYAETSSFAAKRLGAVMVARNIAQHLETQFYDKPRDWRPLVYCWRGGLRSGAWVQWLKMVGWQAQQLQGGYKAWRRLTVQSLEPLCAAVNLYTVAGSTGSGKTLLLQTLAKQGAQIIDLEALARHRGSLLGDLPNQSQPTQKAFETALLMQLSTLNLKRPIFIEAESRRIGKICLPEILLQRIRNSPIIELKVDQSVRLTHLLNEYGYFMNQPQLLAEKLMYLPANISNEMKAMWQKWALSGQLPELFSQLMQYHYDPLYAKSQQRNLVHYQTAQSFELNSISVAELSRIASIIIQHYDHG